MAWSNTRSRPRRRRTSRISVPSKRRWRSKLVSCFRGDGAVASFSEFMSDLPNPFHTLQTFTANGASHQFYSLPALEQSGFKVSRLPISIRLVLESLLRNCDGKRVADG